MLTEIQTIENMEQFFKELILVENLNFHPDEDFRNYVHVDTGLPSYTEAEAEVRNRLLDQCFDICEKLQADI